MHQMPHRDAHNTAAAAAAEANEREGLPAVVDLYKSAAVLAAHAQGTCRQRHRHLAGWVICTRCGAV